MPRGCSGWHSRETNASTDKDAGEGSSLRGKKKLQTVVIGKNVTKIGANAFSKCKKLKKVQITSKKLKKVTKKSFAGIAKKVVIKVPKSKKKAYKKWLKSKKVA